MQITKKIDIIKQIEKSLLLNNPDFVTQLNIPIDMQTIKALDVLEIPQLLPYVLTTIGHVPEMQFIEEVYETVIQDIIKQIARNIEMNNNTNCFDTIFTGIYPYNISLQKYLINHYTRMPDVVKLYMESKLYTVGKVHIEKLCGSSGDLFNNAVTCAGNLFMAAFHQLSNEQLTDVIIPDYLSQKNVQDIIPILSQKDIKYINVLGKIGQRIPICIGTNSTEANIDLDLSVLNSSMLSFVMSILRLTNITSLTVPNDMSNENMRELVRVLHQTNITSLTFSKCVPYVDIQTLIQILPQTKITSLTLPNNISSKNVQALVDVLPQTQIRNIRIPGEEGQISIDIPDQVSDKLDLSVLKNNNIQRLVIGILSQTKMESFTIPAYMSDVHNGNMQALVGVLPQTKIKSLTLPDNISGESVQALMQVLPQTKIRNIRIPGEGGEDVSIDIPGQASDKLNLSALKNNMLSLTIGILSQIKMESLTLPASMSGNDMQALVDVLPQTKIASLTLPNNMSSESVQALMQVLPEINITSLALPNNMSSKSVKALEDALEDVLPQTKITSLIFPGNIWDNGMHALLDRLPQINIASLALSNNMSSESVQALMQVLPQTKIASLTLPNNMSSESVQALTQALPETKIKNIKILGEEGENVSIDIPGQASDKLNLSVIGYSMQSLVIGILPQTKMESLTLPKGMSDGNMQALMDVLPQTKITSFTIPSNISGIVMAILIQTLIQVLPQMNVTSLTLPDDYIPDRNMSALMQVLPKTKIRNIRIPGAEGENVSIDIPGQASDRLNLSSLGCNMQGLVIDNILPQTNMESLTIPSNTHPIIVHALIQALPKTKITSLILPNNMSSARVLAFMQALPETKIRNIRIPGEEGENVSIDISGHASYRINLSALKNNMLSLAIGILPKIKMESLILPAFMPGNDMQALVDVLPQTKIASLTLPNNISSESVQALVDVLPQTKIASLTVPSYMSDENMQALMDVLPQTNITSLTLPNNMSSESVQALMGGLPQTKIISLTLPNNMSSESVQALIQVLPQTQVQNIRVPGPEPGPGQYISIDIPGQEAAELDFSVLNYSIMSSFVIGILPQTNITSVTLPDSMSDGNMQALMDVLPQTNITSLTLPNNISSESVQALIRALPQTKITSLTLPNNMSSESVQALMDALPKTKIRNIRIPGKEEGTVSIDIPGQASDKLDLSILKNNMQSLVIGILSQTKMESLTLPAYMFDENVKMLMQALIQVLPQTNITSLTLPNNMSSESVQALMDALPKTKIRNIRIPGKEEGTVSIDIPGQASDKLDLSILKNNMQSLVIGILSQTKMESLTLPAYMFDENVKMLMQALIQVLPQTNITSLTLPNNMSSESVQALIRALPQTKITSLTLPAFMSNENMRELVRVLHQTNITSLTLPASMSDENMRELVRVLHQTNITSLTLPASMSDKNMRALIGVLPKTQIRYFKIPKRSVYNVVFECFNKTISDTQITSLDLSDIPGDYEYMTKSEIMQYACTALSKSKITSLHCTPSQLQSMSYNVMCKIIKSDNILYIHPQEIDLSAFSAKEKDIYAKMQQHLQDNISVANDIIRCLEQNDNKFTATEIVTRMPSVLELLRDKDHAVQCKVLANMRDNTELMRTLHDNNFVLRCHCNTEAYHQVFGKMPENAETVAEIRTTITKLGESLKPLQDGATETITLKNITSAMQECSRLKLLPYGCKHELQQEVLPHIKQLYTACLNTKTSYGDRVIGKFTAKVCGIHQKPILVTKQQKIKLLNQCEELVREFTDTRQEADKITTEIKKQANAWTKSNNKTLPNIKNTGEHRQV